jgi:hypothetical protein
MPSLSGSGNLRKLTHPAHAAPGCRFWASPLWSSVTRISAGFSGVRAKRG